MTVCIPLGTEEWTEADVRVCVVYPWLLWTGIFEHGRQVGHVYLLLECLAHILSHNLEWKIYSLIKCSGFICLYNLSNFMYTPSKYSMFKKEKIISNYNRNIIQCLPLTQSFWIHPSWLYHAWRSCQLGCSEYSVESSPLTWPHPLPSPPAVRATTEGHESYTRESIGFINQSKLVNHSGLLTK